MCGCCCSWLPPHDLPFPRSPANTHYPVSISAQRSPASSSEIASTCKSWTGTRQAQVLQHKQRCCVDVFQNTFITIEYDFCTHHLLLVPDLLLPPQAQFTCVQHCFTVNYSCKWQPLLKAPATISSEKPIRGRARVWALE